jgi:hypothetical protein
MFFNKTKKTPALETNTGSSSTSLTAFRETRELSKQNRKFTLFMVGSGLLTGFSALLTLLMFFMMAGISNRPASPVVAMPDGSSIFAKTISGDVRSPENVQSHVAKSLTELLTWRGVKPPATPQEIKNPLTDPGFKIGAGGSLPGGTVPTSVANASYALSDKYRDDFLRYIAKMNSTLGIQSRQTQAAWMPEQIGIPQPDGKCWNVKVISHILIAAPVQNSLNNKQIPFNKRVKVCPVPVPQLSSAEQKYKDPGIAKIIVESRGLGMQIEGFSDLGVN